MARSISSKYAKLAQKYRLGIPDKKISFLSSRQLTVPTWLSSIKVLLALFLGFFCSALGLYLIIHTTVVSAIWWTWPWTLATASIPLLFGHFIHVIGKKHLFFLNTLAVILSLCAVTLYTTLSQRGVTSIDPNLYLLDGSFLLVFAAFLFWRCHQALSQPLTLLLCTEGCIVIYQWKRIQVLHWDNVTSVWNTPLSTRYLCKNGKNFTIAHHWPNAIMAREILSGKVLRHIRLQATEMFASGAIIPFGACALSQKGISDGVQMFPWNNIRECEYMDNGVALIGKDTSRLAHFSMTDLPNIAVFVALVNTIAHEHITPHVLL
jgi:hypothetical protein